MEEIMKQVLSSEAFQQGMTPGGEFTVNVTSDNTMINNKEAIQIIKEEPNEKSLSIEELAPSNYVALDKEVSTKNRYHLRSQNQTRRNSIEHLVKEATSVSKPVIAEPILLETDSLKPASPEPTTIAFTLSKQNTNESSQNNSKAISDKKLTLVNALPDCGPIYCNACEIRFNDNVGLRRHLDHVHQYPAEVFEDCRFCKMKGWTESGYRLHLIQSHSLELDPLAQQIVTSNIDRTNVIGYAPAPSAIPSNVDTLTACSAPGTSHPTVHSDDRMLDTTYDPIVDISENQRRTYHFFQTYMLDIS
ncbi:hypothetical protein [Parasitella parasitica]|uniref:C2H2-type domain-containing protein n=1 Tax=Parasitella parasitica TaxID=35722 RepID=A0A0B7NBC8_9FUNG|nr:hypothetical protein [Parasitella parasitica]